MRNRDVVKFAFLAVRDRQFRSEVAFPALWVISAFASFLIVLFGLAEK